jgi:acetyl esterase/lipase
MKKLAAAAAFAMIAGAMRRYLGLRDAMAEVRAELRSPVLVFMPAVGSRRMLPVHRLVARTRTPPGRGVTVTERSVGSPAVRILITSPDARNAPRPGLLWIHSGGLVVGSPQLELSPVLGPLARDLGAVVVSPDYRLAPDHTFPAALDDCMTTLHWMRAHADELGIDPDRIGVGGLSAGGGLAATVAQRSLDEGVPLRAQALVYPMLDDRTALRDDFGGRGRFVFTAAANRFGWTSYLGREPRMADAPEYAAPARRTDLSGLPPAWIGVGDLDLLYDEDVDYAEKLRAAGVPCELVSVLGMYHGADGVAPKARSMQDFRRSLTDHLRAYL